MIANYGNKLDIAIKNMEDMLAGFEIEPVPNLRVITKDNNEKKLKILDSLKTNIQRNKLKNMTQNTYELVDYNQIEMPQSEIKIEEINNNCAELHELTKQINGAIALEKTYASYINKIDTYIQKRFDPENINTITLNEYLIRNYESENDRDIIRNEINSLLRVLMAHQKDMNREKKLNKNSYETFMLRDDKELYKILNRTQISTIKETAPIPRKYEVEQSVNNNIDCKNAYEMYQLAIYKLISLKQITSEFRTKLEYLIKMKQNEEMLIKKYKYITVGQLIIYKNILEDAKYTNYINSIANIQNSNIIEITSENAAALCEMILLVNPEILS